MSSISKNPRSRGKSPSRRRDVPDASPPRSVSPAAAAPPAPGEVPSRLESLADWPEWVRQAIPRFAPDMFSREPDYWDVFDLCHLLRDLVEINTPEDDPLRIVFERAIPRAALENDPDIGRMREAIEFFRRLPEETRRRITNGWRFAVPAPNVREILAENWRHDGMAVFAEVGTNTGGPGLESTFMVRVSEHNYCVRVQIRFGTDRQEAIESLTCVLDMLKDEQRWNSMVRDTVNGTVPSIHSQRLGVRYAD